MATGQEKGSSGIPEKNVLERVREGEKGGEACRQDRGAWASSKPASAIALLLFPILPASASHILPPSLLS